MGRTETGPAPPPPAASDSGPEMETSRWADPPLASEGSSWKEELSGGSDPVSRRSWSQVRDTTLSWGALQGEFRGEETFPLF